MAGERDQPVVEGAVQRDERVEVLPRAGAADVEHPLRELVEGRDVVGARVRDGEPGELRLQRGTQVEDALELGDGPGGDPGTPVRRDLDQALGGEPGQRFPDRGATDAEAVGELDLAQPRAGPQVAVQDQLPQARAAPARRTSAHVSPVTLPRQIVCKPRADAFPGGNARR